MEYKPGFFDLDDAYLRPLLNSTGLTELRITLRFWPDMPPLLTNLTTLKRLDLSSNRIETIPGGESSLNCV
jgi:Leucine-rich repeat (LRR) protein